MPPSLLCHCEASAHTGRGNPFSPQRVTDSHGPSALGMTIKFRLSLRGAKRRGNPFPRRGLSIARPLHTSNIAPAHGRPMAAPTSFDAPSSFIVAAWPRRPIRTNPSTNRHCPSRHPVSSPLRRAGACSRRATKAPLSLRGWQSASPSSHPPHPFPASLLPETLHSDNFLL